MSEDNKEIELRDKMHYIYLITNVVNNTQYVGQTVGAILTRWERHLWEAKNYIDGCPALAEAIRMYGEENFKIECLFEIKDYNELNFWETIGILEYNTLYPNGYNLVIPSSDTISGSFPHLSFILQGKKKNIQSSSKYVGIAKYDDNYFIAQIKHFGTQYGGILPTEIEAAIWYDKMALFLYGDDAKINLESERQNFLNSNLKAFFEKQIRTKKSSSYSGVYWNSLEQKWRAVYFPPNNGKAKALGYFSSEIEAAKTYDKYYYSIHNKCLNFKEDESKYHQISNEQLTPVPSKKTSKYKGVYYNRSKGLWGSDCRYDGVHFTIKACHTEEEAARYYDKFCIFAGRLDNLNFDISEYDINEAIEYGESIVKRKQVKRQKYLGVIEVKLQSGVFYDARVHLKEGYIKVGRFHTPEEAAKMVDLKMIEIYGEKCFRKLNFQDSIVKFNQMRGIKDGAN